MAYIVIENEIIELSNSMIIINNVVQIEQYRMLSEMDCLLCTMNNRTVSTCFIQSWWKFSLKTKFYSLIFALILCSILFTFLPD